VRAAASRQDRPGAACGASQVLRAGQRLRTGPWAQDPLRPSADRAGPGRPDGQRTGTPAERGVTRKARVARKARITREPRVTAKSRVAREPGIPRERRTLRIPGAVRRGPGRLAARARGPTGASRALMVHSVERSVLFSSGRVDAELSCPALSRVAARRRAVMPRRDGVAGGFALASLRETEYAALATCATGMHAVCVKRGSRGAMRPRDVLAVVDPAAVYRRGA